ncbi:MAG: sensor histidine kinase [Rhodospirillaceae bacterium]
MLLLPDILLEGKAALPITLVIHELTTNAAKHGALSTPDGRVDVGWRREAGTGALVVEWQERNGPPVTVPLTRGFGSAVIERSLSHDLGATSALRFDPGGVRCVITIPAAHIAPTDHRKPDHV